MNDPAASMADNGAIFVRASGYGPIPIVGQSYEDSQATIVL